MLGCAFAHCAVSKTLCYIVLVCCCAGSRLLCLCSSPWTRAFSARFIYASGFFIVSMISVLFMYAKDMVSSHMPYKFGVYLVQRVWRPGKGLDARFL